MGITKQQAATLWTYDYKLYEVETGKTWSIDCVANDGITIVNDGDEYHWSLDAKQIGEDFKIIAYPLKYLNEIDSITHELNDFEIETLFTPCLEPLSNVNYVAVEKMHENNIDVHFPEGTTINPKKL